MTKKQWLCNGEEVVPSINGVGKTGQPHATEWNWTFFDQTQTSTQNGLKS